MLWKYKKCYQETNELEDCGSITLLSVSIEPEDCGTITLTHISKSFN